VVPEEVIYSTNLPMALNLGTAIHSRGLFRRTVLRDALYRFTFAPYNIADSLDYLPFQVKSGVSITHLLISNGRCARVGFWCMGLAEIRLIHQAMTVPFWG